MCGHDTEDCVLTQTQTQRDHLLSSFDSKSFSIPFFFMVKIHIGKTDACLFTVVWVCVLRMFCQLGRAKRFTCHVSAWHLTAWECLCFSVCVQRHVFFSLSSLPLIIITSIRLSWLWVHCLLFCCHLKIIKFIPDIYSHPSLRSCLTDILSFSIAH